MRTWAKGSAPAALLAVGVLAFSGGTAYADTSGTGSVGGGNQIDLPITLPVDISGNAVGVAGRASASSRGGSSVHGGSGASATPGTTNGDGSVLGGNQVKAPITAPVNACGNAVSVIGLSDAGCRGGAEVKGGGSGLAGAGGNSTDGRHSVLGGNQVVAPITAPINVCGNAVAVIGRSAAGCRGGATAKVGGGQGAGGNRTSGRGSVIGGNQVVAPITAPINVCGTSVAAIGHAFSGCRGGATVTRGGDGYNGPGGGGGAGGNSTDGRHSVLGGNQVVAPITAPINVCGNAVGNGAATCPGGVSAPAAGIGGGAGGNRTSGYASVLGGNQVVAPITAPINVCGTSVAVIGRAFSHCAGGASVKGGGGRGAGGNRTDGRHSVLGGNQVVAPIKAPINVCGNAVAVLGDAAAGCLGGASVGGQSAGHGAGHWARSSGDVTADKRPGLGLLPEMPLVPAFPAQRGPAAPSHQSSLAGGPQLPATSGRQRPLGLPELPVTPGLPAAQGASAGDPLAPVSKIVSGTPAGDIAGGRSATGTLPLAGDKIGLMSAERPLGVTGMNAGSLVALLAGALFAASATLVASTRRLRRR
ncbi:chaplin [Sphaerisporangium sp. NPDC051011]|uniref:chaplin n=1 Tax=Sphaerisporangium sp. NPDC051011 TaxID=3155792 RepID=UPI0033E792F8